MKTNKKFDKEGNFIFLGRYDFGDSVVGLLGELGTLSGHVFRPDARPQHELLHSKVDGLWYVTVGLDHTNWSRCFSIMLHEIYELAFMQMQTRFKCSENWNLGNADYTFVMTHEQFGEANVRAAGWISCAQSDLSRAFRKYHKQ